MEPLARLAHQYSCLERDLFQRMRDVLDVSAPIRDRILDLISSSMASELFPGAAWMVEEGGHMVAMGHAGYAQKIPAIRPMPGDAIFDLASLTKPICTGTLALLMVERDKLDLALPVREYLPEFSGGWRDHVKVSQVLSHSSGLPSGLPLSELCGDPTEVLDGICAAEMEYTPGSRTLYSDVGFILLGKLLERLSGRTLDSLGKREVFDPLAMHRTMYNPGPELKDEIVATQDSPSRGRVLIGEVHDGNAHFMGGVSGHAGLFSCLEDLARFCRMMLGQGQILLRGDTIRMATRIWADDGANAYGLSWFKRKSPVNQASKYFSPQAYGHTGYTGTSIWIDPTRELFAILLTNRIHPDRAAERIPEMNRTRRRFHDLAIGM